MSTPPHPRPGDPIYSLYAQPSVPVAQPQPVTAHPSQPQPRAQLQAQTSFDQRLALIAQGIAIPPHHYPPGSAPSPHAPTSNLPASDLLRPRPAIAAEQPTPLFGHIPTIAGRDIVIGLSMRGNIALDQAVRYEPDAEDAGEEGAKEAP